MSKHQNFWGWVVFVLAISGYLPIAIGGWRHPVEINLASYSIWFIITGMMLYSQHSAGFAGWRMPFGFLFGNVALLTIGLVRRGSTFDLGPAEMIGLYGVIVLLTVVLTVVVTVVIARLTKRAAMNAKTKRLFARILYYGAIVTDIISYYPQFKQYLLPHELPSRLMILGWGLWILMGFANVIVVEGLIGKLLTPKAAYERIYRTPKKVTLILEESAFSLENAVFIVAMTLVMIR